MSLNTWKEEFYPVKADDKKAQRSWMSAVKHSLQKWKGLRAENLKKHECYAPRVDSESCALCRRVSMIHGSIICQACPLFRHLGNPCDSGGMAPFMKFIYDDDPEPMIKALEETQRKLRSGVLRMDLPYKEWEELNKKKKVEKSS